MIHTKLQPLKFDVIIVYDSAIASSPHDPNYTGRTPFSKASGRFSYGKSYEYFLKYCKQQGLRAAFATTQDIDGSGSFRGVWIFDTNWKRIKQPAESHLIFDKFSGLSEANIQQFALLMENAGEVQMFHSQKIRKIFDDKLKTFKIFSEYAIPTVKINVVSEKHITAAKKKLVTQLKRHKYTDDFTEDRVLKDQFGSGGKHVFKVNKNKKIISIGKNAPLMYFVLQPLIDASNFQNNSGVGNADLRVIVCNGKIVQSYLRTAKPGEFRANASLGGEVKYVEPKKIPKDVIKMAKAINKKLSVQHSFYALDFIKSSTGHLYFIEGNITPGINWFDEHDEWHAKQLMRLIIQDMKKTLLLE